jgi:hypothetical protein
MWKLLDVADVAALARDGDPFLVDGSLPGVHRKSVRRCHAPEEDEEKVGLFEKGKRKRGRTKFLERASNSNRIEKDMLEEEGAVGNSEARLAYGRDNSHSAKCEPLIRR